MIEVWANSRLHIYTPALCHIAVYICSLPIIQDSLLPRYSVYNIQTHGYINCLVYMHCSMSLQDNCVNISNANQADYDGDRVGDLCDNCVYAKNPNQENNDKDKTGDKCDEDDDNDGRGKYFVFHCITYIYIYIIIFLPLSAVDTNDNCPKVYNPGQEDKNRNGWGDVCEPKVEEAVSQEKNMSPKEKTIAAAIMERLLEMYYSSK